MKEQLKFTLGTIIGFAYLFALLYLFIEHNWVGFLILLPVGIVYLAYLHG